MEDIMRWEVTYDDGTVLQQYEPDGSKHFYKDIDRARLAKFSMFAKPVSMQPEHSSGLPVINFDFKGDGHKLVWRRRTVNQNGEIVIFHIVGKKGRYIALVFPDASVSVFDNFDESIVLLAEPQAVKGEE